MENSESWPAKPVSQTAPAIWSKPWARLLLPSFSDCMFMAVFVWLFASGSGWSGLLGDGDTGWHIRTGQWILEHRSVPQVDLYSFTKAGEPWFAWEWLTEVIYALLYQAAGMKGLLLYSGAILSLYGVALFRHMIWKGGSPAVVLPVTLMVIGAGSIHHLARPHVHTLLFLPVALWMIDRDLERPGRAIWLLVPLTVLWTNLHGGFLSLIACLGLTAAGTAIETLAAWKLDRQPPDWGPTQRYGLLTAACALASVANPYGTKLHEHVVAYLRSDWIKNNVQEFMAPRFRDEAILQFEILLFLGVMTALWLVSRRQITPALWILFWGHSALGCVRHVPLYMIVAAPWVAMALTELWNRMVAGAPRNSVRAIFGDLSRDCLGACRRTSIWAAALIVVFACLNEPMVKWPKNFPVEKFPLAFIDRHEAIISAGRVLTWDEWADYLTYRFYPRQKTFIDGRTDFFGQKVGDEYVALVNGSYQWESLMERYRVDTVLAPANWALATILKTRPDWKLVADEGHALLFVRKLPYPQARPEAKSPATTAHSGPKTGGHI